MGIATMLLQRRLEQQQAATNWSSVEGLLGQRGTAASLGGHPGMQDVNVPGRAGSGLLQNASSLGDENRLRLALRMATTPSMSAGGNALLTQYFGEPARTTAASLAQTRALELQSNRIGAQNMRSQQQLEVAQLQRRADQTFQIQRTEYSQSLQRQNQWDQARRSIQSTAAAEPWNDAANARRLEALGPRPAAAWPSGQAQDQPVAQAAAQPAPLPELPAPGVEPGVQAGAAAPPPQGEEVLGFGQVARGTKRVRVDGRMMDVPMPGQPDYIKAQSEVDTRSKLVDIIGEMQDKLEDTGADYVGTSAAEYNALYAQFQASMAQLLELGVLQEGEAERLEERLPNPASFGSNFTTLPATVRAGYAQVMKGARADLDRARRKYKGWGLAGGPAGGGAARATDTAPGGWNQ